MTSANSDLIADKLCVLTRSTVTFEFTQTFTKKVIIYFPQVYCFSETVDLCWLGSSKLCKLEGLDDTLWNSSPLLNGTMANLEMRPSVQTFWITLLKVNMDSEMQWTAVSIESDLKWNNSCWVSQPSVAVFWTVDAPALFHPDPHAIAVHSSSICLLVWVLCN